MNYPVIFIQKPLYRYAVSACLCGCCCKYNGGNNLNERVNELLEKGEAIAVCPEEMGGLNTPRLPCERKGDKVVCVNGDDKTEEFMRGAELVLKLCRQYGVTTAILKKNSPSCGSKRIYDGSFQGKIIDGMGVTAELLAKNGIRVIDEDEV